MTEFEYHNGSFTTDKAYYLQENMPKEARYFCYEICRKVSSYLSLDIKYLMNIVAKKDFLIEKVAMLRDRAFEERHHLPYDNIKYTALSVVCNTFQLVAYVHDVIREYKLFDTRLKGFKPTESGAKYGGELESFLGSLLLEVAPYNRCPKMWCDGTTYKLIKDKQHKILADYLEDQGINNQLILDHLRADVEHSQFCWATEVFR